MSKRSAEKVTKEKRKKKRTEEVWVETDDITIPSISEQQRRDDWMTNPFASLLQDSKNPPVRS